MQPFLIVVCLGLIAGLGCAHKQTVRAAGATTSGGDRSGEGTAAPPKVIVTAETGLAGKVVKVDMAARFLILNFRIGHLPAIDQRLYLYRRGLRVAEVKVCGPQLDDNIVVDLVSGDAAVGDEARDR
jgi:hypothetical protein